MSAVFHIERNSLPCKCDAFKCPLYEREKTVDSAAANLETVGFNLRRMNRGGPNHVTYYEQENRGEGAEKEGAGRESEVGI